MVAPAGVGRTRNLSVQHLFALAAALDVGPVQLLAGSFTTQEVPIVGDTTSAPPLPRLDPRPTPTPDQTRNLTTSRSQSRSGDLPADAVPVLLYAGCPISKKQWSKTTTRYAEHALKVIEDRISQLRRDLETTQLLATESRTAPGPKTARHRPQSQQAIRLTLMPKQQRKRPATHRLGGVAEVADLLYISRSALADRRRNHDFPTRSPSSPAARSGTSTTSTTTKRTATKTQPPPTDGQTSPAAGSATSNDTLHEDAGKHCHVEMPHPAADGLPTTAL